MSNYIYGRNPVIDAVKSKTAKKVFLNNRLDDRELDNLLAKNHIITERVENEYLFTLVHSKNHQGLVAEINEYQYYSIDEIIDNAKKSKYPLILMLDGIEDPHNFGAIIRSADAFGVDGIIIKKNNQVPVNSTVYKVSTGAVEHIKIAQVSNLNQTIDILKKVGFWIVSSDGEAKSNYSDIDYKMATVLVVGSEGFGVSKLVIKNSDYLIKIPMQGSVNSLNASVACGILLANIRNKQ